MPDVGFRYPRADLLKAAADRRGVSLAAYVRGLCDAALISEGFSTASETQYALVSNGEFVQSPAGHAYITTFRPAADLRGEWLPIENEDDRPLDPAKHWRLKPLPLRVDGERGIVIRTYPVVDKSEALL